MANIDAAFGLRPYKMLGAGANTSGLVSYPIQTVATAGSASVISIDFYSRYSSVRRISCC